MAVLEKIRVKFGVGISIIIALALLSFIIDPNDLQSFSQSMSSKNNVGKVAGKMISYSEFQEEVDANTKIFEMITGSSVKNEEQTDAIREQAWQSILEKYLYSKICKNAGVAVSKDELIDLTTGANISRIILADPVFKDENGNFSVANVIALASAASSEESAPAKTYWDYVQKAVYNNALMSKYGAMFTASNYLNALEVADRVAANNNTFDLEFVMTPVRFIKDTTVNVSDAAIKAYYKAHKNEYKRKESRDFDYVVFEVKPSAEDIASANNAIAKVYDEFGTTANMKSFLAKNSDRQLSGRYYSAGELVEINSDIDDFVFGGSGSVSKIFDKDNVFYAARVMDTANLPDTIYVRYARLDGSELTDSVRTALMASQPVPMTQNYLVPGFEPVFRAQTGSVTICKTSYGPFAVQLEKKSPLVVKKQVAILEKAAIPSKETYNNYWSQANAIASAAGGTYEGFKKAVEEQGATLQYSNETLESKEGYGDIKSAKEVTRWAFDNKPGKASGIITVGNNAFFVVGLRAAHKDGYKPLDEVSTSISSTLYFRALVEKQAAEIAERIQGLSTIDEVASALGMAVNKKEGLSFGAYAEQGLDAKMLGAASVAPAGVVSAPIAGKYGVYVFSMKNPQSQSFFTEQDAIMQNDQMARYNGQMLFYELIDDYVFDNRARFF